TIFRVTLFATSGHGDTSERSLEHKGEVNTHGSQTTAFSKTADAVTETRDDRRLEGFASKQNGAGLAGDKGGSDTGIDENLVTTKLSRRAARVHNPYLPIARRRYLQRPERNWKDQRGRMPAFRLRFSKCTLAAFNGKRRETGQARIAYIKSEIKARVVNVLYGRVRLGLNIWESKAGASIALEARRRTFLRNSYLPRRQHIFSLRFGPAIKTTLFDFGRGERDLTRSPITSRKYWASTDNTLP
ncbi:hypothetical protein BaRGS_00003022, partial [Batillaria attramentaria]